MSGFASEGKPVMTLDALACAAMVATPEKCPTNILVKFSDELHNIRGVLHSNNDEQRALFADQERANIDLLVYSVDAELWRRRVQAKLSAMSKSGTNVVEPAWQKLYDANKGGRLFFPRGKQLVNWVVPEGGEKKMIILAGLGLQENQEDAQVYVGMPRLSDWDESAPFALKHQSLVSMRSLGALNLDPKTKQPVKELQDLNRILTATTPAPAPIPVAQPVKK